MKKLILVFVVLITPFCIKAQGSDDQNQGYMIKPGYFKKDIRKSCANEPQNFRLIANTDTCDSYTYQNYFRINCHYKNDTCNRLELIYPFDHNQIKNGMDAPYKKIGNNLWVLYDGESGLETKISYDTIKDLMIVNMAYVK
ncbi:MAG: hypothetical protein ACHQHN_04645 [Sphingobacteriales bacterium]